MLNEPRPPDSQTLRTYGADALAVFGQNRAAYISDRDSAVMAAAELGARVGLLLGEARRLAMAREVQ